MPILEVSLDKQLQMTPETEPTGMSLVFMLTRKWEIKCHFTAFFVMLLFLFVVVVVILLKESLKSDVKVHALFLHHLNISFFSLFFLFFFSGRGLISVVSLFCLFIYLFILSRFA